MRKACLNCGKPVKKRSRQFCSIYCSGAYIGLSPRVAGARTSPHYKQWRQDVLRRDGHICRLCGSNEGLEAHHIEEFAKNPELIFEIQNGITLCSKCHVGIRGQEAEFRAKFFEILDGKTS